MSVSIHSQKQIQSELSNKGFINEIELYTHVQKSCGSKRWSHNHDPENHVSLQKENGAETCGRSLEVCSKELCNGPVPFPGQQGQCPREELEAEDEGKYKLESASTSAFLCHHSQKLFPTQGNSCCFTAPSKIAQMHRVYSTLPMNNSHKGVL